MATTRTRLRVVKDEPDITFTETTLDTPVLIEAGTSLQEAIDIFGKAAKDEKHYAGCGYQRMKPLTHPCTCDRIEAKQIRLAAEKDRRQARRGR